MKKQINFIKIFAITSILSVTVILIGLWSILGPSKLNLGIATPKGFNLSIDFQGGLSQVVSVYSGMSIQEMRDYSIKAGLSDNVQEVIVSEEDKIAKKSTFIIKTIITSEDKGFIAEKQKEDAGFTSAKFLKDKTDLLFSAINAAYGPEVVLTGGDYAKAAALKASGSLITGEISDTDGKLTLENSVIESANTISPAYSDKMRKDSIFLILFVLFIILAYVSWRFKIEFAFGAVIALIHDTLIMLGMISLTGTELDLTVVAAILTIIGYSVNDTIVIFDRIRENYTIMKDVHPKVIINSSINQTLTRTMITSLTTILSVLALFIWGGPKIHAFSFTLMIGLVVGTYSSVFIAAPLVLQWEKLLSKNKEKYKRLEEKAEKAEKNSDESETESAVIDDSAAVSKKTLLKLQGKKKNK